MHCIKIRVSFISGGIIFAASLLFHFMLISMFFPAYYSDVALGSSPVSPFSAFAELFYTSPYLFILAWTFTAFLWGGAMVCIAAAAGMLVRKYSIAVVSTFLIFTAQQIIANYITLRYSILIHNYTVCILWSDMLSAASGIATFANLIYLNIVSIIVTTTLIYVIRGRKYECL